MASRRLSLANPQSLRTARVLSAERERRYWALLASPLHYDIESAIQIKLVDLWTTKRSDIRQGDRVIIWKAKGRDPVAGIVALGEVLSDPKDMREDETTYWVDPATAATIEARVPVRYVVPPNVPLWLNGPADALLRELTVSRGLGGSVFKVQPAQWDAVLDAMGGWIGPSPEVAEAQQAVAEAAGKIVPGQHFAKDSDARLAIERHAMSRATAYFESEGWQVDNISAHQSFDLLCRRTSEVLHVEVKGTTGTGDQVLLTPNEVAHVRDFFPNTALFVVAHIDVARGLDDPASASGGVDTVVQPWHIDDTKLSPLGYAYRLSERG